MATVCKLEIARTMALGMAAIDRHVLGKLSAAPTCTAAAAAGPHRDEQFQFTFANSSFISVERGNFVTRDRTLLTANSPSRYCDEPIAKFHSRALEPIDRFGWTLRRWNFFYLVRCCIWLSEIYL